LPTYPGASPYFVFCIHSLFIFFLSRFHTRAISQKPLRQTMGLGDSIFSQESSQLDQVFECEFANGFNLIMACGEAQPVVRQNPVPLDAHAVLVTPTQGKLRVRLSLLRRPVEPSHGLR
jgi:hypothetical protein